MADVFTASEYLNYIIQNCQNIKFPSYSTQNVDELMKFLKTDGPSLLKFNEQTLFYNRCRFEYAESVFYLHKEKCLKKEIKESFFIFLSKYLDISTSYAQ